MRTIDRLRSDLRTRALRTIVCALGVFALVLIGWSSVAQAFSAAQVYREAANSVVLIFGFEDSGAGSSGTGSIVSADGLVLTNNHVIAQGEDGRRLFPNIMVYFKPNPISGNVEQDLKKPYPVQVIARDPELDLALLRIKNPPPGLRPIAIGNSEEVDIGENVAAIGHPGGGGMWTLTTGTISSKRRDAKRDIFQTDTAINPGNSGGPLLDEHARLVGVNTFVRRVNAQGLPLEGLNYSLRSALAIDWVNRQGVLRLAAVSRANVREPAPAPVEPAAPPRPAPEPQREPEPEPWPQREPEPEPEPRAPREPEPRREPAPAPPPEPEPEAREFTAPDGTRMYGVPNMENDLDEALQFARKEYAEVIKKADKSIREMEEAFDDYDNF